ncbi:MAG: insulinase family protein [Deltaproteobacteria bacterium]|nr:insulinase family protein [Deltaproteobacteria bacterium]
MSFELTSSKLFLNNIEYRSYTHTKFGSTLEIVKDPSCMNQTFALCFVTIPENSKGIPHILEHTVLCGSKKFPLKDPFAVLLRSSVQTFLNAITFHNLTAFPASSFVFADFVNLVNVYWDSVFNPLLQEEAFWTQGIHPVIESNSVKFQGVVYNEMKGYYSEPYTIFARAVHEAFFENSHYVLDSGGDPEEILELSYEELVNFHKKNYTLQNLRILTFGSYEFEKLVEIFEELINTTDKTDGIRVTDDRPSRINPKNIVATFQKSKPSDKRWYALARFASEAENFVVTDLLDACLLGFATSPLLERMRELDIAEKVIKTGTLNFPFGNLFTVGYQDIDDTKSQRLGDFEEVVLNVLSEKFSEKLLFPVYENFKASFIEKFLNNPDRGIQIVLKTCPFLPFGLGIDKVLNEITSFLGKPFEEVFASVDEFRRKLFNTDTFAVIDLRPDESYSLKFLEKEKARSREILEQHSLKALEDINRRLEIYHSTIDEDVSVVPSLRRANFPRQGKSYRCEKIQDNIFFHRTDTNGLIYTSLLYPIDFFEEIQLLSFLGEVFTQVGTKKSSPYELSLKLFENFATVHAYPFFGSPYTIDAARCFFRIDFTCLEDKLKTGVQLLEEMIEGLGLTENFDLVTKLFREYRTELRNQIVAVPARFARKFALSRVCAVGNIDDLLGGIQQVKYLTATSPEVIVGLLNNLWTKVTKNEPLVFTTSREVACFTPFTKSERSESLIFDRFNEAVGVYSIPLDLQVSAACRAVALETPIIHLTGLIEKLVSETFVWNEIRTRGGAYGGNLTSVGWGKYFVFTSWDDPKPEESLEKFRKFSSDYFLNWLSDEDIERTAVSMLGGLDMPLGPAGELSKAVFYEVFDVPLDFRAKLRESLFSCSAGEFVDALQAFSKPMRYGEVIIGPSDVSKLGALIIEQV